MTSTTGLTGYRHRCVYRRHGFISDQLKRIAEGPLVDPIIQHYAIDKPLAQDFDWIVEVGFRPGVTDNVGRTAREALELVLEKTLHEEEKIFTSKQCLIKESSPDRR